MNDVAMVVPFFWDKIERHRSEMEFELTVFFLAKLYIPYINERRVR
jgi:hypothetical protein